MEDDIDDLLSEVESKFCASKKGGSSWQVSYAGKNEPNKVPSQR